MKPAPAPWDRSRFNQDPHPAIIGALRGYLCRVRVSWVSLNGRPINPRSLEGLLFESAGGRLTVTVAKGLRAFAGYARDRNNRDDAATGRVTFGVQGSNLFTRGIDLNLTDSRMNWPGGILYDSWYVSVGRSIGARVCLTGEYTSLLSVLRFTGFDGVTIEGRPRTRRYGLSGIVYATRSTSLLASAERTNDDSFTENRVLAGLTYRF